MNQILRGAIGIHIERMKAVKPKEDKSVEEECTHVRTLGPVLAACSVFSGDADTEVRYSLIGKLLTLAHHPAICAYELCLRASCMKSRTLNINNRWNFARLLD